MHGKRIETKAKMIIYFDANLEWVEVYSIMKDKLGEIASFQILEVEKEESYE